MENRNCINYGGREKTVTDTIAQLYNENQLFVGSRGTGLTLPVFFAVDFFNIYPDNLSFSYGDFASKELFNAWAKPLNIFRKTYSLRDTEFTAFQTQNAAVFTAFLALARTLCGATNTANLIKAEFQPTVFGVYIEFEEDGNSFVFKQSAEAYLSTINDSSFDTMRNAMFSIAFGIASAKEPDFWTGSVAVTE